LYRKAHVKVSLASELRLTVLTYVEVR
jgi:hypothetical protein